MDDDDATAGVSRARLAFLFGHATLLTNVLMRLRSLSSLTREISACAVIIDTCASGMMPTHCVRRLTSDNGALGRKLSIKPCPRVEAGYSTSAAAAGAGRVRLIERHATATLPLSKHDFLLLGPDFWSAYNPEWRLCSLGQWQSPVDIDTERLLFDRRLPLINIDKHRVCTTFL